MVHFLTVMSARVQLQVLVRVQLELFSDQMVSCGYIRYFVTNSITAST